MSDSTQNLLSANIIGLLELETLPDEEKLAMLQKMTELLLKRIMLRVIDLLDEDGRKQVTELGDDGEKIINFLTQKIPNFEEVVKEEVLKLKEEMLKVAEQAS